MSGNAEVNVQQFNAAEFNEDSVPNDYVLTLNPNTTPVQVWAGPTNQVPPDVLYPGHDYRLSHASGVSFYFRTPAAICFDGLGG
jgi:hypothetical protein